MIDRSLVSSLCALVMSGRAKWIIGRRCLCLGYLPVAAETMLRVPWQQLPLTAVASLPGIQDCSAESKYVIPFTCNSINL